MSADRPGRPGLRLRCLTGARSSRKWRPLGQVELIPVNSAKATSKARPDALRETWPEMLVAGVNAATPPRRHSGARASSSLVGGAGRSAARAKRPRRLSALSNRSLRFSSPDCLPPCVPRHNPTTVSTQIRSKSRDSRLSDEQSALQSRIPLAPGAPGPYLHPPRSNARASGPSGYATTSSVLAIVLVAGSFDRFVNSARRLFQAGVQQRGLVR